MKVSIKFLLSIFSFFSCLGFLFAQTPIKVTGKVTNTRNQAVPGASIAVEGGPSFSADAEGNFSLNLAAGNYVFTVSAVGYQSKMVNEIDIKQGADNFINIVLDYSKAELEGVVVTSSRRKESTNALLSFQKNNTSLSSGLAADFIRRTPDRNTSEVLKRVSGTSIQDNKYVIVRGLSDRYNQAMINNALLPSTEPDKKAFSFDVIPSSMIDNIIINKTATPDLPGEFAGGLVQINTKDIPTSNSLSVGFSLGYNTIGTFSDFTSNKRNSTDWLGFDNGNRNIPDGVPGTNGFRSSSDQQKVDYTQKFQDEVYREVTKTSAPITTFNAVWSNVSKFKDGSKFGSVVSVYYRNSQLALGSDAEIERGRYEAPRTFIFKGNETQNRYSVNGGALANFAYTKGKTKIAFKNLFNQLYEDNYYTRLLDNTGRAQEVSLRSSFANQRSLYSGQLVLDHTFSNGYKLNLNGNGGYNWKTQPDFRVAQYVRSTLGGPNEKFEMDDDDSRRFFSDLKDYSYGASGSLEIPFIMKGEKQSFKFGGSTNQRIRDFRSRVFRYKPASPQSDITIPYDEIFLRENVNLNGVFLDEQTQNTDTYFGASALSAGFVMFDNKIGKKFRVIWGARGEYFEQFLQATDLSLKKVIVDTDKFDFLPSVNATYSLTNTQQIRFSASKTVARPEFREIAPFQFFDYEQIWGIAGTPELQRTSILNFDARYEVYPKAGEALSFGAFVKSFNDPIELRMDPGSNGDRWLFNYSNADKALLYGFEVEARKKLDFIGKRFEDFTIFANLTYLDSKVTITTFASGAEGKIDVDRPLYGQSPYLINAGLQYSKDAWNASLLYNRIGPRLFLVGDPPPFGAGFYDIYEAPRNLLDFQVSKKMMKDLGELKLTVSDILNNKFRFYDNPSTKAGYNFDEGDRINYAYRPGTVISLSFTYDFKL